MHSAQPINIVADSFCCLVDTSTGVYALNKYLLKFCLVVDELYTMMNSKKYVSDF